MSNKTVKMNVVVCESGYGTMLVFEDRDYIRNNKADYTIISESVEVEFPLLSKEEYVKEKIASLQAEEDEIKSKAFDRLSVIAVKKQELLALEYKFDEV